MGASLGINPFNWISSHRSEANISRSVASPPSPRSFSLRPFASAGITPSPPRAVKTGLIWGQSLCSAVGPVSSGNTEVAGQGWAFCRGFQGTAPRVCRGRCPGDIHVSHCHLYCSPDHAGAHPTVAGEPAGTGSFLACSGLRPPCPAMHRPKCPWTLTEDCICSSHPKVAQHLCSLPSQLGHLPYSFFTGFTALSLSSCAGRDSFWISSRVGNKNPAILTVFAHL